MTARVSTVPVRRGLLVGLVLLNVMMQLGSALLLKIAPPISAQTLMAVGTILGAVLLLNVVRFLVWGALHRRFPLSVAYPASALFFPGVLFIAWQFGERIGMLQLAGAAMILFGVALLLSTEQKDP